MTVVSTSLPQRPLAMTLQVSSDIVSCIFNFTEWGDVGNLLTCSKAMQFPGVEYIVQSANVKRLEIDVKWAGELCDRARVERDTFRSIATTLYADTVVHLRARVVCVDCDVTLSMRSANEIETSGRYLCGECKYERTVVDVREDWHTERGLTVEGPRRHRCRRCEEDSPIIGSQLLCPECIEAYNLVINLSLCYACHVNRDAAIGFYTRWDHEGVYCDQCVGNQARERCTVDRGIGILEAVRGNVVSDVMVVLGDVASVSESEAAETEAVE